MPAAAFVAEVERNRPLRREALCYAHLTAATAMQIAAVQFGTSPRGAPRETAAHDARPTLPNTFRIDAGHAGAGACARRATVSRAAATLQNGRCLIAPRAGVAIRLDRFCSVAAARLTVARGAKHLRQHVLRQCEGVGGESVARHEQAVSRGAPRGDVRIARRDLHRRRGGQVRIAQRLAAQRPVALHLGDETPRPGMRKALPRTCNHGRAPAELGTPSASRQPTNALAAHQPHFDADRGRR